jgi:hypothetical protein
MERLKYGVVVPRNVAQAYELDRLNGNNSWHEAIRAEIDSLITLECFEFHDAGYNPGKKYQWTSLTVIFDVKQDLRLKARLVAGGHLVDSLDNNVYSSIGERYQRPGAACDRTSNETQIVMRRRRKMRMSMLIQMS